MKATHKVVVVSGAGSGMGRQVVELLRRGARVAAVDVDGATLEETVTLARGGLDSVFPFVVDVTDEDLLGR